MPNLKALSEQANAFAGTQFGDVTIVSSLLNQYVWSDGKTHDVMDIGWQSLSVPGIHFLRVEALDGWQDRAIVRVDEQICYIQQIYLAATDNSACQGFVPASGTSEPGTFI